MPKTKHDLVEGVQHHLNDVVHVTHVGLGTCCGCRCRLVNEHKKLVPYGVEYVELLRVSAWK